MPRKAKKATVKGRGTTPRSSRGQEVLAEIAAVLRSIDGVLHQLAAGQVGMEQWQEASRGTLAFLAGAVSQVALRLRVTPQEMADNVLASLHAFDGRVRANGNGNGHDVEQADARDCEFAG